MLYIVSTPIGNLKDITLRALEVLKSVDLIAAEDTRHTRKLCAHYEITTPLTSFFEHNERDKGRHLIERLKQGKDIALVSDAGTPGISDPGFRLINMAKEENIAITVVPGVSAVIAALSLSGFPSDAFIFDGFLPVKSAARRKKLASYADEKRTVIVYESVHRLIKTLEDFDAVLPQRVICVARELTKKFEEAKEGTASELLSYFSKKNVKGEFVILIR